MLYLFALYIGLLHHSQALPLPEHTLDRKGAGCQLDKDKLPGGISWWHAHAWVQFLESRWTRLLSIRPGEDTVKSLKDCADWLKALDGEDRKELKAR